MLEFYSLLNLSLRSNPHATCIYRVHTPPLLLIKNSIHHKTPITSHRIASSPSIQPTYPSHILSLILQTRKKKKQSPKEAPLLYFPEITIHVLIPPSRFISAKIFLFPPSFRLAGPCVLLVCSQPLPLQILNRSNGRAESERETLGLALSVAAHGH